ncbi:hypothetical protein [Sphingomicrobium flavum]|uniref:hypothetical protein n=1 Tax=Sphingomicrobium flavum TaxID=1229164 RepID=UPI0021ADAD5D|nr:hypothetical protein [Sphingomicrobium flavum]
MIDPGFGWSGFDFMLATLLLGGTGLVLDLLLRSRTNRDYRLASVIGFGGLLFLIWSNLAVGIVGSENDAFNQFYFLCLPVIAFGAMLARLKPGGMAKVMASAAAICGALMMAAFALGKHLQPKDSVAEVLIVNLMFVTLFATSAWFFRRSAIAR